MQVSDFQFTLPDDLVARYPTSERTASRLLHLDGNSGRVLDSQFCDLLDWINPDDLLVFNNTRVIPARLFGRKLSGGKVEVLIERILDSHRVLAHIRASKSPKPGATLIFDEDISANMLCRQQSLFELVFVCDEPVLSLLDRIGHIPLPPYIDRPDEREDKERYQTVYSQRPGAVAAPTAGLHFDNAMLAAIKSKGIETAYVTLHIGAGTFQTVRVDTVEEHTMHSEFAEVDASVVDAIKRTRKRGGRVIAVGTTSVRSLEAAARVARAKGEELLPFADETDIFLYPGQEFLLVDAMITNFHLPESTLIMLVAAFAGQDNILNAYRHAVAERYRFFSYGDAMFITRRDIETL